MQPEFDVDHSKFSAPFLYVTSDLFFGISLDSVQIFGSTTTIFVTAQDSTNQVELYGVLIQSCHTG
jgi:hypothetical protein